jgi:hypothetical protein
MADSYLSISAIANDGFMVDRLNACTTQQYQLGSIHIDEKWGTDATAPLSWVSNYRFLWASSPGWGAAWDYALAAHPDAGYEPGKDPGVITDDMILSSVQALAPLPAPPPEVNPLTEPEA